MSVGLFVPCGSEQFYPGVAVATLGLLDGLIRRQQPPVRALRGAGILASRGGN